MKNSKLNEAGPVITPNPRPAGLAVQVGSVVGTDRLIVADNNDRILSVNLMNPITRVLATSGSGPGQVIHPSGIAVDPNTRNIFVADSSNHRVQKFTPNFVFIKAWGKFGTGNSEFNDPKGIAVDSNGNIYVADFRNHRVQKFDSNGVFNKAWGSRGTGNSQFNHPYGIAVESDDDIVVADMGNHRIQKFKSDSQFIRKWGSPGKGNSEFNGPVGIAVDSNNDIYVVDEDNHRVQKFDLNGQFIKSWGSPGTGDGQFSLPWDIAFNSLTGSMLVSDIRNDNIQTFTTDGMFSGKVIFGPILQQ